MSNPPRPVGRPSLPPEEKRCTARAKHRIKAGEGDERCRNYRAPGFTVCEFHGAATPVGMAAPGAKHGRYSRVMPRRLTQRFETLVTDTETLNLARDLALLDTRIEELLGRIDEGESETGWRRAGDAFTKLRAAMTTGDGQVIREQIQALTRAFAAATAGDSNWRDIRDALQERRLIVESERRRLVDLHQMVTVEELMVFANALVGIVNAEVADQRTRTSIAMKVRGLLSKEGRPSITVPVHAIEAKATTVPSRYKTPDRDDETSQAMPYETSQGGIVGDDGDGG